MQSLPPQGIVDLKVSGIYRILCLINNNIYIGSAKNIKKRRTEHFYALRLNNHWNRHLQNAFNLYGEEYFVFEVIELCSIEDLASREEYWDKQTPKELRFNMRPTPSSNFGMKRSENFRSKFIGKKASEETRQKISESKKGNKNPNYGNLPKKVLEAAIKANTGRKQSLEVIRNRAKKNQKPVIQIDLETKKELERFESIKDASIKTGTNYGKISSVCSGKIKSAGGFGWRLADE